MNVNKPTNHVYEISECCSEVEAACCDKYQDFGVGSSELHVVTVLDVNSWNSGKADYSVLTNTDVSTESNPQNGFLERSVYNGSAIRVDNNVYDSKSVIDSLSIDMSNKGLNEEFSETCRIDQLCNCRNKNLSWCFVHNNGYTQHMLPVNKDSNFVFISHASIPTPLLLPLQLIDSDNLIEWVFIADQVVASSKCFNYKSPRIKVPTELNIKN